MEKVVGDANEELRDIIFQCFPTSHNKRAFPGAMPVNMTRSAFREIQEQDYWVSEKTDGVRCVNSLIFLNFL